jgi:putative ABC transport system permease protein
VLLGEIAAKITGKDIGDMIRISRQQYRIAGVYRSGVVFFDGAISMPLAELQKISHKEGQVTSFQVDVRPGVDPAATADRLEREIDGIVAIASVDQYKRVDQGYEIMKTMNKEVSLMAILIGSIIVANTMWMSVNERTKEIGVLRAVGWSKRAVVGMIIIESAGVSLLAWIIGGPGGIGLAELTKYLPMSAQFLDPVLDLTSFAVALVVAIVLGVLGGALPAWRAARISPVEALRYE